MLAIIVPYYNIQFFEETLKSVSLQTDKRFNVYIGNDASTTKPNAIIEKYKNSISIFYKEFPINLGQKSLVNHWSRCIDLIQNEEWIQILGDDDVLASNCIAEFYQYLDEMNACKSNVVRFASQKIDDKGSIKSEKYTHPEQELASEAFYKVLKKKTRSSLSEYVFKKEAYLKHGFQDFPLAWFSDTMAWFDFSENTPIYSINEATVSIRFSEISISGKADNMHQKYRASYLFYKRLLQNHFLKFSRKQQKEIFKEYVNYVHVTRSYTWGDWRIIVWNALKKLDFKAIKNITRKIRTKSQ